MYLCSKNKKDMAYKKGQDRRQRVLFPDCIDEYVEADAPVRLFDAFVDNLKMNELGFVRSTPAETGTHMILAISSNSIFMVTSIRYVPLANLLVSASVT